MGIFSLSLLKRCWRSKFHLRLGLLEWLLLKPVGRGISTGENWSFLLFLYGILSLEAKKMRVGRKVVTKQVCSWSSIKNHCSFVFSLVLLYFYLANEGSTWVPVHDSALVLYHYIWLLQRGRCLLGLLPHPYSLAVEVDLWVLPKEAQLCWRR